ncbi:hypothetical protein WOLCODRAFT_48483, partial [Wolfiporia cocos MD-104 SS10]
ATMPATTGSTTPPAANVTPPTGLSRGSCLYDVPFLENNGLNFQTWKHRTMTVLDIRGLLDIVTGDEKDP